MTSKPLFKHSEDRLPNLLALSFILIAYLGGLWLLYQAAWLIKAIGVFLLAEAMILAAFFVHEFAHGTIFSLGVWNKLAGKLFMWLSLHGFFAFEKIQQLHSGHHRSHADVILFDFHAYLLHRPFQKKLLQGLEWLYIPAVELSVKWHSLLRIWKNGEPHSSERRLILSAVLVYSGLATALAWQAPSMLLGVSLAYLLLLHVLRLMDMHQHTYLSYTLDAQANLPVIPAHDKAYEQANTYSNLFQPPYAWLNLLVLNFSYHNAHHAKPFIPWCRLPELHEKQGYQAHELPISALFINYHRLRVARVANPNMGKPDLNALPTKRADTFQGVIGVSFLNA